MISRLRSAPLDALVGLAKNASSFAEIWADDDALACFWSRIHPDVAARAEILPLVVPEVRSVRDLRGLIRDVAAESAAIFLDDFVLDRASRVQVVAAMVESPETFRSLPSPGAWVGHALYVRGSRLLNAHPGRRFAIGELIPIGADADRPSARSLLSSAGESGQLTAEAIAEAKRLFPTSRNDRWT